MAAESIGNFKTLCILQFPLDALPETIEWITKKVKALKEDGGGGLDAVTYVDVQMHNTLHVGASHERLLEVAEDMNLRKLCVDGTLRQFSRAAERHFENCSQESRFFTTAEKQRMVLAELDNIRALPDEASLPGYPAIHLQPGESIVRQCVSEGIIQQVFSLHDKEQIATFGRCWYNVGSVLRKQPIEAIRSYFGEKIGFYFAFLGFYTWSLVIPTIFAIAYRWFDWGASVKMMIAMALLNVIWPTMFLKAWKRHSSELAYSWGMTDLKVMEPTRATFYGETSISPVTGKPSVQYPRWKRNLRIFRSTLVVVFCLLLAYAVMELYLHAQDAARAWHSGLHLEQRERWLYRLLAFMPGVVYSLLVVGMNKAYKYLAVRLTEWENHRVQSSYEKHLILKLVSFLFVNTFAVLFYITFYYRDTNQLQTTLVIQLVVVQIVDQLQETLIPFLIFKWRELRCKKAGDIYADYVTADGLCLESRAQAEVEATKAVYEGTFDDYLELFIQFGYVTLFSCIYPLAGVLAVANNVVEIRSDAVKLCQVNQRPYAEPASSIGVWQFVFEAMVFLSLITNCAIVGMSIHLGHLWNNLWPELSDAQLLFYVMAAEHILVGTKLLLSHVIPDMPNWVAVALARDEYQSKMASVELMKHSLNKKTK